MNAREFSTLFDTHWNWQLGVFATEVLEEYGVITYFGKLKSAFFDVAIPTVDTPQELELDSIIARFKNADRIPSFYLTQDHQEKGFREYLSTYGFSLLDSDTWMVFNTQHRTLPPNASVVEVTPDTFADYYSVLSVVFKDFNSNETYLNICRDSISRRITSENYSDFTSELFLIYDNGVPAAGGGMFSSKDSDFTSELFLIYDNGVPAAGGGMFSSKEGNFAYLHDAGTLDQFRGKGYQTDLIRYRTNKARESGITRIYSLVEQGGQSWKNMTKNGFEQLQVASVYSISK